MNISDPIIQAFVLTGLEIAKSLVLTLVGVLAAWALAQTGKSQKTKNLNGAIEDAQRRIYEAVNSLQQTCVEQWKLASEDGKLTPEEIAQLNTDLIALVRKHMTPAAVRLIEGAGMDLDSFIISVGDQFVRSAMPHDLKEMAGAVMPVNPAE